MNLRAGGLVLIEAVLVNQDDGVEVQINIQPGQPTQHKLNQGDAQA